MATKYIVRGEAMTEAEVLTRLPGWRFTRKPNRYLTNNVSRVRPRYNEVGLVVGFIQYGISKKDDEASEEASEEASKALGAVSKHLRYDECEAYHLPNNGSEQTS